MNISIKCAPGESEWQEVQIGEWLEGKDEVVVDLLDWSPSRLMHRFDVRLRFQSGEAGLYRYFPFAFKIAGNAPQAEIGEIESAGQVTELLLEQVVPQWRGRLVLSFVSEQSGVPKRLGLGADERDLALQLGAIFCRQSGPVSSAGNVHSLAADLDLEGRRATVSPIFIMGSGRCGTSVLTWALGQHPNIMPLEETGWLPMTLYGAMAGFRMASAPALNFPNEYEVTLDAFLQHIGRAFDHLHQAAARSHVQMDFLQRLSGLASKFDQSFQRVRTNWSPKQRWADGTPGNTGAMPVLARAFPDAQFVGIIRDPLDVIASYKEFHTVGGPSYSIDEAATAWLQAAAMLLRTRESLGARRVMVVDYGEFARPEEFIRRVMRFLGEPNCTSCFKPLHKRINSSEVSEEKRTGIEGPLVERCVETYAKFRAAASWRSMEWGDDLGLAGEDWLNDLIDRLIKTIS